MHIISMLQHRDTPLTNVLIAQGVKSCEKAGIPYPALFQIGATEKRGGTA